MQNIRVVFQRESKRESTSAPFVAMQFAPFVAMQKVNKESFRAASISDDKLSVVRTLALMKI